MCARFLIVSFIRPLANISVLARGLWARPVFGYPPDLQDAALRNVLQHAEVLSAEWAV
jgi:hypothetical protein